MQVGEWAAELIKASLKRDNQRGSNEAQSPQLEGEADEFYNGGRKDSGYIKLPSLGLLNGQAIDPVNFIVYIV